MSGQFNTGESKFKAQMSIVFGAQMSYRFTGKKAQTSCARSYTQQRTVPSGHDTHVTFQRIKFHILNVISEIYI